MGALAGIGRTVAVVAALGGIAALSGCSGEDDGDAAGTQDAAPATTSLSKGDEATYLKALRALDPELVADRKTAVDNGYNLCLDRTNGMTVAEMTKDAVRSFSVDVKKAQKIVAIASTNLCE